MVLEEGCTTSMNQSHKALSFSYNCEELAILVLSGPQRISQVGRNGYGSQWRLPLMGTTGAELARVLGGGVVPGSLTLVGGDPGVG